MIVVDDLHWVDAASGDVIAFVARRLWAERIAILLAARPRVDWPEGEITLRSLPLMRLKGLDARAAGQLLPNAAPSVVRMLVHGTSGSPLAMLEVVRELDAAELSGRRALPRTLPLTTMSDRYVNQLDALPDGTQLAACVLALAGQGEVGLVAPALQRLGLSLLEVQPLEQAGLVRFDHDRVRWRHPLVRAAAGRATAARRDLVHRALADCAASLPGHKASWAWHAAASTPGPDVRIAHALARVAQVAAERDASLAAARAWEEASSFCVDDHQAAFWLALAGKASARGGAAAQATTLLERAIELGPQGGSGWVLQERGRLEHVLGRPTCAYDLLLRAAREGTDRRQQVWAAAEAVLSSMYAVRPDLARVAAVEASDLCDEEDPVQRFLTLHAQGAAASLSGDLVSAGRCMDEALLVCAEEELLDKEPDLLLWVINARLFLGGAVPSLDDETMRAVAQMKASGELVWSPRVLRLASAGDLTRGAWTEAFWTLEDGVELARLSGQTTQVAEGLLALGWIYAARGQRERCLPAVGEAYDLVSGLEVRWLAEEAWHHRGLLHLGLSEHAEAANCYRRALSIDPWVLTGLTEALVRCGRRNEAVVTVRSWQTDRDTAAYVIASALVEDPPASAAERIARAAVSGPESTFDRARYQLLAGELYRRAGMRRDARGQLREAEKEFSSLQTLPWLARARDELRASGATLRTEAAGERLTPGELRVATMTAQGKSTKEVAAALFLSPKTIEFHLGRVYRKLGIRSRSALAARLRQDRVVE